VKACERREHDCSSMRTITVRRAVSLGKVHKPKSGHERIVPILDELQVELVARGPFEINSIVASNAQGKQWGQGGLYELFERIAKRAGLSNLSRFVHNLRHYFATALFRAGAHGRESPHYTPGIVKLWLPPRQSRGISQRIRAPQRF
jgi:site-specific recombinase XerD